MTVTGFSLIFGVTVFLFLYSPSPKVYLICFSLLSYFSVCCLCSTVYSFYVEHLNPSSSKQIKTENCLFSENPSDHLTKVLGLLFLGSIPSVSLCYPPTDDHFIRDQTDEMDRLDYELAMASRDDAELLIGRWTEQQSEIQMNLDDFQNGRYFESTEDRIITYQNHLESETDSIKRTISRTVSSNLSYDGESLEDQTRRIEDQILENRKLREEREYVQNVLAMDLASQERRHLITVQGEVDKANHKSDCEAQVQIASHKWNTVADVGLNVLCFPIRAASNLGRALLNLETFPLFSTRENPTRENPTISRTRETGLIDSGSAVNPSLSQERARHDFHSGLRTEGRGVNQSTEHYLSNLSSRVCQTLNEYGRISEERNAAIQGKIMEERRIIQDFYDTGTSSSIMEDQIPEQTGDLQEVAVPLEIGQERETLNADQRHALQGQIRRHLLGKTILTPILTPGAAQIAASVRGNQ